MQSILDMEEDRDAGRKYDTKGTLHGTEIMRVITTAKKLAWQQLMQEDSRAATLKEQKALESVKTKQRKGGNNTKANQIEDLLSFPK
jgi:hypothetical protein